MMLRWLCAAAMLAAAAAADPQDQALLRTLAAANKHLSRGRHADAARAYSAASEMLSSLDKEHAQTHARANGRELDEELTASAEGGARGPVKGRLRRKSGAGSRGQCVDASDEQLLAASKGKVQGCAWGKAQGMCVMTEMRAMCCASCVEQAEREVGGRLRAARALLALSKLRRQDATAAEAAQGDAVAAALRALGNDDWGGLRATARAFLPAERNTQLFAAVWAPELTISRPRWLHAQLDESSRKHSETLLSAMDVLSEEVEQALQTKGQWRQNKEGITEAGAWEELVVQLPGRRRRREACALVPLLCRLLSRLEKQFEMWPVTLGVRLSALSGGGGIASHVGPTNCRVRMHLPLLMPPAPSAGDGGDGSARVYSLLLANERIELALGEPIFFDDSCAGMLV